MQVTELKFTQLLKTDLDTAWKFFSSPQNLNEITPSSLSFTILSDVQNTAMYRGMIIRYKVSPFSGIRMNWVTEITQAEDRKYFIDEQRFGPYALWHHQHHFEETPEGVLMTDILNYKVGFGFLGNIANSLIVANKIQEIFSYRKTKLDQLFNHA